MRKDDMEEFSAAENPSVHKVHVINWHKSAENPGVRHWRVFRRLPKSRASGTESPGLRQKNCRTPGHLSWTGLRRYRGLKKKKKKLLSRHDTRRKKSWSILFANIIFSFPIEPKCLCNHVYFFTPSTLCGTIIARSTQH